MLLAHDELSANKEPFLGYLPFSFYYFCNFRNSSSWFFSKLSVTPVCFLPHTQKAIHRAITVTAFRWCHYSHSYLGITMRPFAHEALSLSTRWILSHRRGIIKSKSIRKLQRWNWNLQYISSKVSPLQKSLSPLGDHPVGKLTSSTKRQYNSTP